VGLGQNRALLDLAKTAILKVTEFSDFQKLEKK
jgi:hypothetical protein